MLVGLSELVSGLRRAFRGRQAKKFSGTLVGVEARDLKSYVNVKEYFMDFEDGTALTYALELDNPYILSGEIDADGVLAMRTLEGSVGPCLVTVVAVGI